MAVIQTCGAWQELAAVRLQNTGIKSRQGRLLQAERGRSAQIDDLPPQRSESPVE